MRGTVADDITIQFCCNVKNNVSVTFVHAIENKTHDFIQKNTMINVQFPKTHNSTHICSVRTVKPEETKNVTKCLSNTIP